MSCIPVATTTRLRVTLQMDTVHLAQLWLWGKRAADPGWGTPVRIDTRPGSPPTAAVDADTGGALGWNLDVFDPSRVAGPWRATLILADEATGAERHRLVLQGTTSANGVATDAGSRALC